MERLRKILPVFVLGLVALIVWLERRAQAEQQMTAEADATPETRGTAPTGAAESHRPSEASVAQPTAAPAAAPTEDVEPVPAEADLAAPAPIAESDMEANAAEEIAPEAPAVKSAKAAAAVGIGAEVPGQDWVEGDGSRDCPPNFPIKGNANSMIYHQPGESSYDVTIPEICFASEDAAQTAGYRPRRH